MNVSACDREAKCFKAQWSFRLVSEACSILISAGAQQGGQTVRLQLTRTLGTPRRLARGFAMFAQSALHLNAAYLGVM